MVKQLGAIAALGDIVAFNTEVADELRAVFDDFRSTRYGQGFETDDIENFKTDEVGQSSFVLYNKPGEPDFSLRVELQSGGVAEIYFKSAECSVTLSPWIENHSGSLQAKDSDSAASFAAAKVIGSILDLDLDHSSRFGLKFHRYIAVRLSGRELDQAPELDFPGKEPT